MTFQRRGLLSITVTPDQRERVLAFVAIAVVFALLLLPERDYVPLWDGRVYANCVIDAAAQGLSFDSLRCANHPTYGWAAPLAALQLFHLGDVRLLFLGNLALGILALASIRIALTRLFPAPEHARALDIVTLACAVHPVLLSTLVQVNVDFGVYVFFCAMFAAMLSERYDWAAVAGTFLCFSKETGALAAAVLVGSVAFVRLMATPAEPIRARVKRLTSLWPALIPLLLFGLWVLWWKAGNHPKPAIWRHDWNDQTTDAIRLFDLTDPVFLSYAAGIFVVGFGWVVSSIIAADLVVAGTRFARRLPPRAVPGTNQQALATLGLVTLLLVYGLTSFRTWSNLRYFALIYPLLLMLAYAALVRLGARATQRAVIMAAVTLLFALGAMRSVDPVSRAVYGTFSIGSREMYRMSSITGEFGGPGRDELVYNLEFTGFHHLQNAFFAQLRPGTTTWIGTARSVRWNIWSQLNPQTLLRTLAREQVLVPRYTDEVDLATMPSKPTDVYFLEFSNHADRDNALTALAPFYRVDSISRIHFGGHILVVRHLVRREASAVP